MTGINTLGQALDEKSLPNAIRWLFESNGYSVKGPLQIHGSEIDLMAEQKGGYGGLKVYIEATVQHVDVTKYGKDLTKLTLVSREPGTRCLIVSSTGFTVGVRERAAEAGIDTYTYDELYRSFGRFDTYIDKVMTDVELTELCEVYIEPTFDDQHGKDPVLKYVKDWIAGDAPGRWMIVVGEYGTGKTALTRALQRQLMEAHIADPRKPIPFRIELRSFNKQFDARSLLHHFLDENDLGHLNIDYVEALIASGSIVLLLDGYDEMAQYLTLRERRACLEAMSHLGSGGSKGILTSRPNYFTEAEELNVYEALYRQLETRVTLTGVDAIVRNEESRVDSILEKFIFERAERSLRDLSPEQTEELLSKRLKDDPHGKEVVLGLLSQITRHLDSGDSIALSGKPVIISYLLDVVEELKSDQEGLHQGRELGEWQIFTLIVDKLMLRDWRRTPDLMPAQRLRVLQDLAVLLARRENRHIEESAFRDFVKEALRDELRRREAQGIMDPGEMLFQDIRSSTMLTRTSGLRTGWLFSHNSLREFLLVQRLTHNYLHGAPPVLGVTISDAMQSFVRSMDIPSIEKLAGALGEAWPNRRRSKMNSSQMFSLLWPAVRKTTGADDVRGALARIVGEGLDISDARLTRISFSCEGAASCLAGLNASGAELSDVDLQNVDLSRSSFAGSMLEAVNFAGADLRKADFSGSVLLGASFVDAKVKGAIFLGLDRESSAIVLNSEGEEEELIGDRLIGSLRFSGATTDEVGAYFAYSPHRDFVVLLKVCRFLMEEGWRQRIGIEQKGSAVKNIPLARKLVQHFLSCGYLEVRNGGNALVRATPEGRAAFSKFVDQQEADEHIISALERHMR